MDKEERIIAFPFKGIDVSRGIFDQREGTSPFAVNVRGYGPDGRLRGGTRPGLTPLFGAGSTEQVEGFHLIQSLSVIVTASQGATFSSNFITVNLDIHYSETDHPPARDSPITSNHIAWYENTKPTRRFTTEPVVGVPDGGGTGRGTASWKFSTDGTNVTLVSTFESAGFPGPYAHSDAGPIQTQMKLNTLFFNPVTSGLSGSWTVISGSFIGNLFWNFYYPGP